MAPWRLWAREYVACSCLCERVRVSILVWGLTDCDCISIGFIYLFILLCKRRTGTQTEKWDQMGKLISPFPRHIPFQIAWSSLWCTLVPCTLVPCTASSTTQGITGANEVWEWDRDEASGKEVDQRNRSRERERERKGKRANHQSHCGKINRKRQSWRGRRRAEIWWRRTEWKLVKDGEVRKANRGV